MKNVILFFILIQLSSICFSQDIIMLTDGDSIKSRIIEIGVDDISYKKSDSTESNPIYKVLKSDVAYILYNNGNKDVFQDSLSEDDLYENGIEDAKTFYRGYKTAATATFVTSIIYPILGLVPAVVCSVVPPNESTLNFPDEKLMYKPPYRYGYIQKAKKMKASRVWINWLIPAASWAVVIASIVLLVTSLY